MDEIYDNIRKLDSLLRDEGLLPEADKLWTAFRGGATGTEILMSYRWELEHILDTTGKKLGSQSYALAQQLLADSAKALRM